MGTKVDLERLADTLREHGYAYLVTCNEEWRPHAVAVRTTLCDEQLHIGGFGWRSRANAENRPDVALVYPPMVEGSYSLIVDGTTASSGEGLVITPTVAVLHRPPRPEAPPPDSGCASDCQRLEYE